MITYFVEITPVVNLKIIHYVDLNGISTFIYLLNELSNDQMAIMLFIFMDVFYKILNETQGQMVTWAFCTQIVLCIIEYWIVKLASVFLFYCQLLQSFHTTNISGGFLLSVYPPPPRPNIFKHTPTQPTSPLSPRFVIILCVSFIIYYPHTLQLNQKTRK